MYTCVVVLRADGVWRQEIPIILFLNCSLLSVCGFTQASMHATRAFTPWCLRGGQRTICMSKVLSYHVYLQDQTRVVCFGGRYFYPVSQIAGPFTLVLKQVFSPNLEVTDSARLAGQQASSLSRFSPYPNPIQQQTGPRSALVPTFAAAGT